MLSSIIFVLVPTLVFGKYEGGEGDVIRSLLSGYNKDIPAPMPTFVNMSLSLIAINEMDRSSQTITTDSWLVMEWVDKRLTWDLESGGPELLHLPISVLWFPDITLYNNVDEFKPLTSGATSAVVFNDGTVMFVPKVKARTYCNVQASGGVSVCTLSFGPWTFDGLSLTLGIGKGTGVSLSEYRQEVADRFEPVNASGRISRSYFECCPDVPYELVNFELTIQQKNEN